MTLLTQQMHVKPLASKGTRICIMQNSCVFNRHLRRFEEDYHRPMYDAMLKLLAPSKELKEAYKKGVIDWKAYVPRFKREVLEPQAELIQLIGILALSQDITLLCSEPTPDYCHRRLIAEECKKYHPNLALVIR
jgi:uncharacterized protein YeaO (DUF488 family)